MKQWFLQTLQCVFFAILPITFFSTTFTSQFGVLLESTIYPKDTPITTPNAYPINTTFQSNPFPCSKSSSCCNDDGGD